MAVMVQMHIERSSCHGRAVYDTTEEEEWCGEQELMTLFLWAIPTILSVLLGLWVPADGIDTKQYCLISLAIPRKPVRTSTTCQDRHPSGGRVTRIKPYLLPKLLLSSSHVPLTYNLRRLPRSAMACEPHLSCTEEALQSTSGHTEEICSSARRPGCYDLYVHLTAFGTLANLQIR